MDFKASRMLYGFASKQILVMAYLQSAQDFFCFCIKVNSSDAIIMKWRDHLGCATRYLYLLPSCAHQIVQMQLHKFIFGDPKTKGPVIDNFVMGLDDSNAFVLQQIIFVHIDQQKAIGSSHTQKEEIEWFSGAGNFQVFHCLVFTIPYSLNLSTLPVCKWSLTSTFKKLFLGT
jgi:hypothetical protein